MKERPVCVRTRAYHVSDWQETATQSISESWSKLETQHYDAAQQHTHPSPPPWPFLNVTGHLAHWLGL